MSKRDKGPISDEQRQSLSGYAIWKGTKTWRNALQCDWMRGGSAWPGDFEPLYQLRNTHGPGWLMDYTGGDDE